MNFYEDPIFKKKFHSIAATFLSRSEYFTTRHEALMEVLNLTDRVDMKSIVDDTEKSYVSLSRVGMKVKLDRKKRKHIAMILENALNHASIESGYF